MHIDPTWVETGNLSIVEVLIVLHNAAVKSPEQMLDVADPVVIARVTDYLSNLKSPFIGKVKVGFVLPSNKNIEDVHLDVDFRHINSEHGFNCVAFNRLHELYTADAVIANAIKAKATTGFAKIAWKESIRVVAPINLEEDFDIDIQTLVNNREPDTQARVAEWLAEAHRANPSPPTSPIESLSEDMPVMPTAPLSPSSGSSMLSFSKRLTGLTSAFRPVSPRNLFSPINSDSATPPTPIYTGGLFARLRSPGSSTTNSRRNSLASPQL